MLTRSLTLTADLANLSRAREFVRHAAEQAGFAAERVFDIMVASSEAIANAIEHSPRSGDIEARALLHADHLEIQVEGPGRFEIRRRDEERRHRGLGLPLMATLADHLSLSRRPGGGTIVALSFDLPAPAKAPEEPSPAPPLTRVDRGILGRTLASPWLRSPRAATARTDRLFWMVVMAAVVLVLSCAAVYAVWGTGEAVGENVWYVPLMHGFAGLAALCIGFLALGHYRVLRERFFYWVSVAFITYAVSMLFFVLSWPGLRGVTEGVIAGLPSTSARIAAISLLGLGLPLLVGVIVQRPGRGTLRRWRLFLSVAIWPVFIAVISVLFVLFEDRLPSVVDPEGRFGTLLFGAAGALLFLFVLGAALSTRRYLRTGDALLAYAAMSQLAVGALIAALLVGTERYDIWYYFGRVPLVIGFLTVMFGLLAEYMRLFRRERQRTEELSVAQAKLRESEQRFRTMANAIPQLAWLAHADGYIYWYNDRWYEYTGTTPSQMEGWGWQSVHDPNELPNVLERWKRFIATGEPFGMELPMKGADGVYRPFLTRVMPIKDDRGAVVRWVGTNTDVSEIAGLRTAVAQELQTTRVLLETADALADWTDLRGVLETLTQAVVGATRHTRATFALWDETTGEVRTVASSGDEPIPPFTARLDEFSAPFQAVTESRQPMIADYDALPKEQRGMAEAIGSHLGLLMPLIHRDHLVGGLFVDDPGERTEFTKEEIRLIEGIGAQGAVAIENARLFEAQQNIASTLQQVLLDLPEEIPGVRYSHLYRSATEAAAVGGDFYNLIRLRSDSYMLLIGDVSGHGIEAAQSATFVRDAVEAFASKDQDAEQIMVSTNEALLRRGLSGFVTVLLATISPDRRWISFCSAGHPHFLLRRHDGQTTLPGMAHHPPLGVFPTWSCDEERMALSRGDLLLFYTDGVIEARRGNELFGEDRLIRWLERKTDVPLADLPSALLADVLAFSEGTLKDDAAILAVRIEA